MHKLAVVGSRAFVRPHRIRGWLSDYRQMKEYPHIVTGDAKSGADFEAIEWAKAVKLPYTVYPANWYPGGPNSQLDRGAGFKRNALIVMEAAEMVCFWDGTSHGTAHDIHLWYMKTGYQPLVFGQDFDYMLVPHQQVVDLLEISRRKLLTGHE